LKYHSGKEVITMAIEKIRGCGYRKVGGLYLVSSGHGMSCDRLPYELSVCPVCGAGVKFSRGFQWIDWYEYAGEHENCSCSPLCPICHPALHTPLLGSGDKREYGLLGIGEQFYTPDSFIAEAINMGASRRIAAIPRKLKLGITWILCAQVSACGGREEQQGDGTMKTIGIPGVFYVFHPTRIEKLIWESDAKPELLESLKKSGITPIIIPDGDPDHDPRTPLLPDVDTQKERKREEYFAGLRNRLQPERPWEVEEE